MRNERKIKWSDNRSSLKVIALNLLLTAIQLTHMLPKVYYKLSGFLKSRQQKNLPDTAQVTN
jgi:hypothetical protein